MLEGHNLIYVTMVDCANLNADKHSSVVDGRKPN